MSTCHALLSSWTIVFLNLYVLKQIDDNHLNTSIVVCAPSNNMQLIHIQHHMLHIILQLTRIHIHHARAKDFEITNDT